MADDRHGRRNPATGPSETTTRGCGRPTENRSGTLVSKSPVAIRVVGMTRTTGSAGQKEPVVAEYLLYFNQQWVGDHPEEWFRGRGPLARAAVDEMKAAGVYVFAGGLEEEGSIYSAEPTGGDVLITDGPYVESKE